MQVTNVQSEPATTVFAREPIDLVKEYVSDTNPEVRANAATALATLAQSSPSAAGLLADMALEHANLSLQYRLVDEIASLHPDAFSRAMSHLLRRRRGSHKHTSEAANLLLVRLRMRGVRVPTDSIAEAFRNAWQRASASTAKSARRPSLTLVAATLVAGVLGSGFTLAHVVSRANLIGDVSTYVLLVVGTAMAATALALVSVWGSTPAYTHLHRTAAAAFDVLGVLVFTTFVSLFAVPLVLAVTGYQGSAAAWIGATVFTAVAIGGLAGCIRAGTLLSSRLPPRASHDQSARALHLWLTRWALWAFLVEASTGLALGLLATMALWALAVRFISQALISDAYRVIDGVYLFALSASLPLAVAFALIDRPTLVLAWLSQDTKAARERKNGVKPEAAGAAGDQGPRPSAGWPSISELWARGGRRVLQIAALLFVAFTLQHVLEDAFQARPGRLFSQSGALERHSYWFLGVPAQYDFGVTFAQRLRAEAAEDDRYPHRLVLSSWSPLRRTADEAPDCSSRANEQQVESAEDPPRLEADLGWGCYSLRVRDVSGVEERPARMQVITALLNSWSVAQRVSEQTEERAIDTQELRMMLNEKRFSVGKPSDSGSASDVRTSSLIIDKIPEEWPLTLPANTAVMLTVVPPRARMESAPAADATREQRAASSEGRHPTLGVPLQVELFSAADASRPVAGGSSRFIHIVNRAGQYTVRVSSQGDPSPSAAGRTVGLVSLNLAAVSRLVPRPATPPDKGRRLEDGMTAPREQTAGFWRFDRVPASFTFRLEARRPIVARLPEVSVPNPFEDQTEVVDLVLYLDHGINQLEQNDSDPEEIARTLDPGEYTFRIEELGGDTRDIGFATLNLAFGVPETKTPRAGTHRP